MINEVATARYANSGKWRFFVGYAGGADALQVIAEQADSRPAGQIAALAT
jgi:hypothetical protein